VPIFSNVRRQVVDRVPRRLRNKVARALPDGVANWYEAKAASDADHFFLSPPKAGRTWLRTMVGRAFQTQYALPADTDIVELHELHRLDDRIPTIVVRHDNASFLAGRSPLSETAYREFDGNSVLLLVRDPRDVVVSMYFHLARRLGEFEGSLSSFLEAGYFDRLVEYYRMWGDGFDAPERFCLVRYEDMKADAGTELARVMQFFSPGDWPEPVIADAVAFGSFDNLRQLETTGGIGRAKRLTARDVSDPSTFKTRRGEVGGFVTNLSPEEQDRCAQVMRDRLPPVFGYGSEPS
jgi:hypothetical protein